MRYEQVRKDAFVAGLTITMNDPDKFVAALVRLHSLHITVSLYILDYETRDRAKTVDIQEQ